MCTYFLCFVGDGAGAGGGGAVGTGGVDVDREVGDRILVVLMLAMVLSVSVVVSVAVDFVKFCFSSGRRFLRDGCLLCARQPWDWRCLGDMVR